MQRLTVPISRPRVHLLAFHDVLAPDAKTCAGFRASQPRLQPRRYFRSMGASLRVARPTLTPALPARHVANTAPL